MHCLASVERFRVRAWPAVWLAVCSLLLAITEPSTSAPEEIEAGFDIRNARIELVDGVFLLDADLSFVFSDETLEAIENGVPVTIILEMQVLRERGLVWDNLWWDEEIASIEAKFRIETRPLSKTYLVRNLNSGEARVFGSLGELVRIDRRRALLQPFDHLDELLTHGPPIFDCDRNIAQCLLHIDGKL